MSAKTLADLETSPRDGRTPARRRAACSSLADPRGVASGGIAGPSDNALQQET
jgi:hypothetical protein